MADEDAQAFALPPFEDIAGLNDAELLQKICREGLEAAGRIFHRIKYDPVLVCERPREVAALVSEAGDLIAKALNGLKSGADLRDARTYPSASGHARARENDPLAAALAAWEQAGRDRGADR